MKFQYRFDILFLRINLKRILSSDGALLITLQNKSSSNHLSLKQDCFMEHKIGKGIMKLQLEEQTSLKFTISEKDKDHEHYDIQLQIQGALWGRSEKFHLPTAKMISQFQENKKQSWDEVFQWRNGKLQYTVKIMKTEQNAQNINPSDIRMDVPLEVRRSSSFSRTKRPPQLNISKKEDILKISQSKQVRAKSLAETKQINLFKGLQEQPKILITKDVKKYPEKGSPNTSFPQALSAWFKRKPKPLDSVDDGHVKALLQSHHPVESEEHRTESLSIKLKIVLIMLIVGFGFLLVDTLTDRSIKKFFHKKKVHFPRKPGSKKQGNGHKFDKASKVNSEDSGHH